MAEKMPDRVPRGDRATVSLSKEQKARFDKICQEQGLKHHEAMELMMQMLQEGQA